MTREEAIERLNIHKSTSVFVDSIAEAIDMAIEALSVANLKEEFESAEYEDYEHATLVDIKEPLKVSVVRCKDCRFNKYPSNDLCLIKKAGIYPDDDDFCSYGERREP